MSESKHTPGPWYHRSPTGFVGTVADSIMVASVYGDDPNCREDGRQIANARLIAAAPEMLEALQAFEAHYPLGVNPFLDDAFRSARAAIAKAEGTP